MFTYALCGIAPSGATFFIIAEIIGAISAALAFGYILPSKLKDKCDPFDCKAPTNVIISMDVLSSSRGEEGRSVSGEEASQP